MAQKRVNGVESTNLGNPSSGLSGFEIATMGVLGVVGAGSMLGLGGFFDFLFPKKKVDPVVPPNKYLIEKEYVNPNDNREKIQCKVYNDVDWENQSIHILILHPMGESRSWKKVNWLATFDYEIPNFWIQQLPSPSGTLINSKVYNEKSYKLMPEGATIQISRRNNYPDEMDIRITDDEGEQNFISIKIDFANKKIS